MSKARNLSDFISDATVDATEIADGAVTAAKLHTSLDLSSKTVTFADDHISGNKIHGGIISGFASTGIDDNASSTAITIDSSGNVGIGTDSPNYKLDIVGSSENLLELTSSGSYGTGLYITQNTPSTSIYINSTSTGDFVNFLDNGTTVFKIQDGGKVGIGTASPSADLHVYETGASNAFIQLTSTYADGYDAGVVLENTHTGGRTYKIISTNDSRGTIGGGKFCIVDNTAGNSASRLAINSSGKVGIGTDSPNNKLHVNGSDSNLIANQIQNTEGSGSRFDLVAWGSSPGVGSSFANRNSVYQWTGGGIDVWSRTGDLRFGSSNELRFQVNSTGDVLVKNDNSSGTNSVALPGALIFEGAGWNTSSGSVPIQGQIHLWGAYNNPTGGSVEPALVFSIKGSGNGGYSNDDGPDVLTERMRIDNYGNVGIGNTNPQSRLHVGGTNATFQHDATHYTGLSSSYSTVFDLDTYANSWASGVIIYVVGRENGVPGVNKSFARYTAVKTNSGWISGGPYDTIKAGNDHGYPEVNIATDGSFQVRNRLGSNIGDCWITVQLVCS